MSKTTSKSRFSRLLPKFLRGDKSNKTEGSIDSKTPFCFIHFLDDSHHQIQIKGNWKGSLLQEKVCELLSLHEKDYFGLRFIDTAGQTHWLDGNKSLSSQFKGCQTPHKLYFGVKFYAADPCKLREEITRYLFFLQVKQDILQGRLPVTFDEAAELCAYAVQSELGDFDPHQNTAGYVSEFCFVPNQTEELERRIAAIHRRLGGMVPMMAEYRYLDKVKWLDMYGVDLHPVMGEGNVEYFLGLTPTGIVVYKNKNKVGNYFWPRINKVTFKGKIFIVKVKDKNNEEHAYAFELPRKTACKHLWKCCVEHHAFFSGRSERQAVSDNLSRHPSNVVRLQSRRQPRRINSDSKLNSPENYESQYDHDTGMVTMLMRPEPVRAPRHHSLPELQGHESPRSTKSAPWETNFDYGLYTHGKDSPVSERSNKMREQRNRAMTGSDSESGISQRRKYFPNRRGSDNDSDVSVTRRRRRDIDSDSASDISSRYPASHSHKSAFPVLYPFHDKENRPNGSIPSLHSAPAGESKQRRRRRRSKSPGKRPPEELKQHFEYGLKDTEGLSTEELKEIPFVNIETKASLFKLKYSPKLRQKVKAAKQKSLGDLDQNRNQMVKRQTSAPLDDEMDRAASVHSQPISRKDPEDRDSTSYTQSGGPYDSDNNNNNTARRRKDRRQDQNSDTARNNSYRNSGRQSRGHLQEQDQSEQDGRMEAEYERLQQQPVSDSRMDGSASRPGQVRGESQQVAESYSGYQYRDGSSEQTHYMAPPPASQGAPPPYQVHQSSNVSYSSFTSPPQNYYHHHHHHQQQPQQQPPRRPASTLSPYANPPSQNYHNSGRVSPYNSVAPHGHYDQGQRPRSYGQDDDGRSKLYHDEGHKLREREGDWSRGYSQEKGQRSRYRDDSDRPRSSFHEEHLARPPRPPYQGEPQRNQYDHRSPSGYQHNTSNYQPPPRQYQQQSPQPQYQGAPARHQGTPPRHQGTPPRQQGTPPRQQGTPPRQPVFSTPPRQSMDPRYSQGLVSMHAREQSEGSSSQASVLGGGNYHRSPRPSPAHSGSDRSGSRNLGNSLTSEQTRQLLRSPNYNPDLCTEL